MMWFTFVIMILIGLADIVLLVMKRDTISQRYHRLFPQWLDLVIMIAVLAVIWTYLGAYTFIPVMAGVIIGHLAWHENG